MAASWWLVAGKKKVESQVGSLIVQKSGCGMKATWKEAKKSVSANTGQARPKRILIADDNKAIRDMVSGCLEFIGYEVSLAFDGIEALAVFLKAPFDLVLTDYEMPAMDGMSLAGHIKARSPNTPVILLTGADRENVLKRVGKGLVDSVVFKPFLLENLEKTVQGVLASSEQEDESAGAGQLLDDSREAPRIAQCL